MLTTHRRRERGSVLMLMPAAVLVMLVLGSIVVDFALVEMRARSLQDAAAGAANDAATAGLSTIALRAGETRLDAARTHDVVVRALALQDLRLAAPPVIEIGADGRTVTVRLVARHPYLFASALPGAPDTFTVAATATAHALVASDS